VLLVTFLTSPFSAGTVTISPRKLNAARAPVGDSAASRIHFAPFANRGRVSRRSDATPIVSFFAAPPRGSNRCSDPACS
jgi:hypothetical protein